MRGCLSPAAASAPRKWTALEKEGRARVQEGLALSEETGKALARFQVEEG